ncbi:TPA: hypothetical protein QDC44_008627 [Burkholderia cepacia ATCC 25416]|nr:hypothetical protein [Burkholderia cepacia ATCC 25416]
MFRTIGYKGHFIHVSVHMGVEMVETQIMLSNGGYDLERRNTVAGAQRAITKHLRNMTPTGTSA